MLRPPSRPKTWIVVIPASSLLLRRTATVISRERGVLTRVAERGGTIRKSYVKVVRLSVLERRTNSAAKLPCCEARPVARKIAPPIVDEISRSVISAINGRGSAGSCGTCVISTVSLRSNQLKGLSRLSPTVLHPVVITNAAKSSGRFKN